MLLAACGSGSGSAEISAGELHACEIVPGVEISRLVGGALIGSNVDVERNSGADAFSQCTHTLDSSPRRVTVQVRRSGKSAEVSRQEDADKARAADDGTGYGIKFAEAIEAGKDIDDLGVISYAFEIGETLYVVAHKDKQSAAQVWMSVRADNRELVLQYAEEIARLAIDQL